MFNKTIAFIAALVIATGSAQAQTAKTKASLNSEISSQFQDNSVGGITPQILRTVTQDMVASAQQFAGVNPQAGTSYTVQTSDYGQLVTFNNAASIAVSLPSANSAGFNPFNFTARNIGAGAVTITPVSGTINGLASYTVTSAQSIWVVSDGTNWQTAAGGGTLATSGNISTNGGIIFVEQMVPAGRLTIVNGGCTVVTDQVAQTTLYYAPCGGQYVPVYDGTVMAMRRFTANDADTTGASINLATNAVWAANTLYDVFYGWDSGSAAFRLCTGPAWSNSSAGTSLRSLTLASFKGVQTNSGVATCRYSATNTFSCATSQCTYLGTVFTGASNGTIDLKFGTNATNCGVAQLAIYNAYNQQTARASVSDTTNTWAYTAAVWRPAHGSVNCAIYVVAGQNTNAFSAKYFDRVNPIAVNAYGAITLGLNGPATIGVRAFGSLFQCTGGATACIGEAVSIMDDNFSVGLNVIYALEQGDSINANIFSGQNSAGGQFQQQLLTFTGLM